MTRNSQTPMVTEPGEDGLSRMERTWTSSSWSRSVGRRRVNALRALSVPATKLREPTARLSPSGVR